MRSVPLLPEERTFRLDRWVRRHLSIVEESGVEIVAQCPACGRDKLAVNTLIKAFRCFVCPFRGWSPVRLVSTTLGISQTEARAMVAQDAAGIETGPIWETLKTSRGSIRRDFDLPPASFPRLGPLTRIAQNYLIHRKIPQEHWTGLGLQSAFSDGKIDPDGRPTKLNRVLPGRIVFPVWNLASRCVFWAARSTDPHSQAKVINYPKPCRRPDHDANCTCYHEEWGLEPIRAAATADEVVLGLHWLIPGQPAIVTEGPTDVAVCGPGFCATLGAHISVAQAILIARSGASEAILLYDGDVGGSSAFLKAEATLSQFMPTRAILCPKGTDPGELGRARSLEIAHSAPPPGGMLAPQLYSGSSSHNRRSTALHPFVEALKSK